jgi:hypothetical protein
MKTMHGGELRSAEGTLSVALSAALWFSATGATVLANSNSSVQLPERGQQLKTSTQTQTDVVRKAEAEQVSSEKPSPEKDPKEVELPGTVVCLPELMHKLYGTDLPANHEHVYGFRTDAGELYTLLHTRLSEALFADERVRAKKLLLKGRVFPKSRVFEVTRMRSIRNGAVCDLYYYCSVCNIESVSPGPCECCQGPVELMEKPLAERHGAQTAGAEKKPARIGN